MSNEEQWHWYNSLHGLSFREKEELLTRFPTIEELYHADEATWISMEFHEEKTQERVIETILDKKQREDSKRSFEALQQKGIRFVSRGMTEYPEKLKEIAQPPFALYYYGELPKAEIPALAIVGARQCSVYGEEIAAQFARRLSEAGIQILSGMARGIDASAQRAAISGRGRAYAVLGSGVDVCYPREHKGLYEQLKERGGILSEEVPGTKPLSMNFPKRNRIISALSDGVLVVEAREKSGSLITAEYALEQGKDIFAVPGRIYDSLSAGTNRLIKEGAYMVCEPEDILEPFFGEKLAHFAQNGKKENFLLETKEKIVYASLSLQPKHIGQIARETNLPLPELTCLLLEMEMKHYIKQTAKNFYIYGL